MHGRRRVGDEKSGEIGGVPSNITSMVFFYTHVLMSFKDGEYYIGYTNNLKQRIEEHNAGKNVSTKPQRPLKLIYEVFV